VNPNLPYVYELRCGDDIIATGHTSRTATRTATASEERSVQRPDRGKFRFESVRA
jgi:hypothetical protein